MEQLINEDLGPITSCEGQVGQATEAKTKTEVTVGSEAPGESRPLPAQKMTPPWKPPRCHGKMKIPVAKME